MNPIPRVLRRILAFASRRSGEWRERRGQRRSSSARDVPSTVAPHESHADERTIRRMAEDELGGTSSAESREAYLRGENPGGLHHGGHGPNEAAGPDDDQGVDPMADTLTANRR
jgi:hypothetical protein